MQHHKFPVERTGHVYTIGNNIDNAKHIWFVFHGYGQLASRIIKKFDGLDMDNHFVIALEGLSRFYWKGVTGDVAASWMTKQDRLGEIDEYLQYIQKVYNHFDIKNKQAAFHCLGFSQGTATTWRWIANYKPQMSTYVQWAGTFPPEIDYAGELADYISSFDHYFLYGDEDIYLTSERVTMIESAIAKYKLNPMIKPFKGKHKIYRKVLHQLVAEVESK